MYARSQNGNDERSQGKQQQPAHLLSALGASRLNAAMSFDAFGRIQL
jgi:hypothetical protein